MACDFGGREVVHDAAIAGRDVSLMLRALERVACLRYRAIVPALGAETVAVGERAEPADFQENPCGVAVQVVRYGIAGVGVVPLSLLTLACGSSRASGFGRCRRLSG